MNPAELDAHYRGVIEALAEMAEAEADARVAEQAGVTKAILALMYELRRQDIGAEIVALTQAVKELTEQAQAAVALLGTFEP